MYPHRIYYRISLNKFYYYNFESATAIDISANINLYEWNRITITMSTDPTAGNVQQSIVYVNYNFTPTYIIPSRPALSQRLKSITFCGQNPRYNSNCISNGSLINMQWGSAYYGPVKVWVNDLVKTTSPQVLFEELKAQFFNIQYISTINF